MQAFFYLIVKMKIFCIGMNYRAHVEEMGKTFPAEPVIFLKPETALLQKNRPFFLPDFSNDVEYELEVVVRIGKLGKCISPKFAHTYYDELTVGIDFTARDIQKNAIRLGHPWDVAKGFDNAAPIGDFRSKSTLPHTADHLNFHLLLNDEQVQTGNTADMIFGIDELISKISQYYTLKIGDLIFTGTPLGVGKVGIGDHLQAFLEGEKLLDFYVR